MISVPNTASPTERAAALSRRIVACRASATVLICGRRTPAADDLLREVEAMETELAALRLIG